MWAQCEMCLSVSFGNMFPRPRKELERLEMGACEAAWVHTSTNSGFCVHKHMQTTMQGHTDTCIYTDESMLVLKTPMDSEIDMKTSGMEQNRKWVFKEKAACLTMCAQVSQSCDVSNHFSRYPANITHLMCAMWSGFHVVAMCTANTQTLCTSQLTMCHIQYSHNMKKCEPVHLVYF